MNFCISPRVRMVVLTNGKCPEHLHEYRMTTGTRIWPGSVMKVVDSAGGTPYIVRRTIEHVDSVRPTPLSCPE